MLNVSNKTIREKVDKSLYKSFSIVENHQTGKIMSRIIVLFFIITLVVLLFPWTQNIRSYGTVTTVRPEQRPQTVQTVIGGRIEKWFVKEGDVVDKGDTILFISEVINEYLDPDLVTRTSDQIKSRKNSILSYREKVRSLENQITALVETRDFKLKQGENKLSQIQFKVQSDSVKYLADSINFLIAIKQFDRIKDLYAQGLKSLTEFEKRELVKQKAESDMIASRNSYKSSQNELKIANVELLSIKTQYNNSVAKSESEKFESLSQMYNTEATVSKLENEFNNYSIRNGLYYVTAPQSGNITKAIQSGIGETIKAGEEVVSIMPAQYDLAVEMYVDPMDLPLIQLNQSVRIQFDGWPAIVFSGWPNNSIGTFGGKVIAIDKFISSNGKFRILVAPSENDEWPSALRVGGGSDNILLLDDVPVWYELWRKINGFPPNFYNVVAEK